MLAGKGLGVWQPETSEHWSCICLVELSGIQTQNQELPCMVNLRVLLVMGYRCEVKAAELVDSPVK